MIFKRKQYMPSDLFTIKCLCAELNDMLSCGRVQKVTQPETDEIRIEIKNRGERLTLVISANPVAPRCHLSSDKKDNPISAPTFCMLLRKYLLSCEVKSVSVANDDRIFCFEFEGRDELCDNKVYKLYFELMSRYSNIILTNSDGQIFDCLHRINFDANIDRVLVPTIKYSFPKKADKAELNEYDKISEKLLSCAETSALNAILQSINGLSKQTANEFIYRSCFSMPANNENIAKLLNEIKLFNEIYNSTLYKPAVLSNYSDFFATPYLSLKADNEYILCKTLNEACELTTFQADKKVRIDSNSKDIVLATKRYRDKLVKKIGFATEKLAECENMENIKISGELLMSNLYKLKKGDTFALIDNYYDEYKPTKITLDEKKTPQQNATSYYTKYAKLKRAKSICEQQVSDYTTELEYINSILESLERASLSDVVDIKQELSAIGVIKKQPLQKGSKKPMPSKPKSFLINGYCVYVGTNNALNNTVTFELGRSYDIWFHIKNLHGSHAIIRKNSEDESISSDVILKVAEICAYYSTARNSQNVAIDFTERRNVKRIKGGGLGMVNYQNYKTVFINPNPHDELLI